MKKIYFLSDAHLGSWAIEHRRTHERRLVSFLDKVKKEAAAVYMLGDMFDFWYEFKNVVPKGFARFLGKVAELTDNGVEVHFFTGNHDIWCLDYFEKECGMIIHREPCLVELYGKEVFIGHGDEFSTEKGFRVLRAMFHSRFLQRLLSMLHPRWSVWFGHKWAHHSMIKHKVNGEVPYLGEEKEALRVVISGDTVENFDFICRSYTPLEQTSDLLPPSMAVALASMHEGAELTLAYVDNGEETIAARWFAR